MLRASIGLRRTRSAWLLVSCLMLSVLITAALVSALLSFYSVALPATVRHELAASGAMELTLTAETSGSAGPVTAAITRRMRTAFGPVPYQQQQSLWSNDLELPGRPAAGNVPVIQAASFAGIGAHARLVTGSWPAAPQAGQPLGVALPAAVAGRLRLPAGSVLRLHFVGATTTLALRVTGVFRPLAPDSNYWRLNQVGPSGASSGGGFDSYGPAVVSPAAFGAGGILVPNQATFVLTPDLARLPVGDLSALAGRLSAADRVLQSGGNVQVATTMPGTLADVAEGLVAARSLVVISGLQLLLLAGAALALAGRLLASQRDEETALLAARGAARWQLMRPSLIEGVLVCAIAAAAGAVAGAWLATALLGSIVGEHVGALLGEHGQPAGLGPGVWLAVGLVFLGCLLIAVWPALRPPAIGSVRVRRGRQAAVASVAAAGADIALIALAIACVHELLSYSAASAGSGIDPVIVAAPVLALAGLALIPLRLLPLAARGLERLTARGRRLGTAMANWEISRRPVRQSGPALLVILAVGTSTLALAQYQSWQQSAGDQARFAVGAPVRVSLLNPQPMTGVTAITRLRGVTAAMPVSQQPLASGQLLAIGARQAAATVTMRSDLSPVPLSRLWGDLDQSQRSQAGLLVPGQPQRLAITASMTRGYATDLGPITATVTVQDAYGLAYALPAGSMPSDGKPHELVIRLGATAGVAYPLRIIGVELGYSMPVVPPASSGLVPSVVTFRSVAASPSPTGAFGAPFAAGRVLSDWSIRTGDAGLQTAVGVLKGQSYGEAPPSVTSRRATGQDTAIDLALGNGPYQAPSRLLAEATEDGLPADVQLTVPAPRHGVPLLATSAFLKANGLTSGSPVGLSVGGTSVEGTVVQAVARFPTVTSGGAVIADEATLQDALVSAGGVPLPATSWWLATAGGTLPAGLPFGSSGLDAASVQRALQHDVLSVAPVKAALAVAVAAAVLAAVGFCVSVAASARARRGQRALLAALGVHAEAQARLFCLEEMMISGPAALVGLVLGVALAHVLVPAITLTATA